MSQMLKSTSAMGLATLLSRILGMAREVVYANFMGASVVAGAFKTALMIPNLFRRLLGEGALTAAFIPIFKDKEKNEGEAEMWRAANSVLSGLMISASIVVALVILGITVALWSTAPETGFSAGVVRAQPELASPEPGVLEPGTRLMLELARVMFPYMLLACIAAVLMGMLNARGVFFVPALGACIMNVVLIASVYLLAPRWGDTKEEQIFALAWAVLIAGVAQAAYQMPALLRDGFRPRWVSPFNNPVVQRVVRQMIPGMLGVAAFQFNVITTTAIAFMHSPKIVASYDYAVRLMELPQGLFGISLATYLLPTLAGLAAEKKYADFRATYKQAVGYLFFTNVIATVLLVVLAKPMIRLLFQHGAFTPADTINASFALACLGPGLLAFTMVNITARAFYALGDTQIPMKISAFCLLLNVFFAWWLIPVFREGGMGVANTMSAAINVYLLLYALKRKLTKLEFSDLRQPLIQMLSAAILAGIVAYSANLGWENYVGNANLFQRFGAVFVPIAAAAGCYVGVLAWLGVPQVKDVLGLLGRRRKER
jgi:putative peptidoglycan lipid II flippase